MGRCIFDGAKGAWQYPKSDKAATNRHTWSKSKTKSIARPRVLPRKIPIHHCPSPIQQLLLTSRHHLIHVPWRFLHHLGDYSNPFNTVEKVQKTFRHCKSRKEINLPVFLRPLSHYAQLRNLKMDVSICKRIKCFPST